MANVTNSSIKERSDMDELKTPPRGFVQLQGISPAEDDIGPFYYLKEEASLRCGFLVRSKNCNGLGTVHGGVLMSFADYSSTMSALQGVKENCATVSFNCQFIASARLNDWIEATAEVIQRTGSLCFLTGKVFLDYQPILTFQSVVKRLPKP